MPWDLDADVSVTEADMYFLAAYHNMTIYYYQYDGCPEGCFFQLEINPYHKYRERDDYMNFIDARWIDMQNGLFIDITAARYDPGHEMGDGVMYDKHDHEFKVRIFGNDRCLVLKLHMTGQVHLSSIRHHLRRCSSQDSVQVQGDPGFGIRQGSIVKD